MLNDKHCRSSKSRALHLQNDCMALTMEGKDAFQAVTVATVLLLRDALVLNTNGSC